MTFVAALTLAVWVYLLALHGRFWSAGPVLEPVRAGLGVGGRDKPTAAASRISTNMKEGVMPGVVPVIHALPEAQAPDVGAGPVHGIGLIAVNGVGPRDEPGDDGLFEASGQRWIGPGHDGSFSVDIVIPARNEAEGIEAALRSLLAQDYAGGFHITVVDDGSDDGTGAIARGIGDNRLTVIDGAARPAGWSGKLWAVAQGVAQTNGRVILLTDADIVHEPAHLSTLVAALERGRVLVSEMVELRCASWAERALVPAFVFFFQLLYPFARVNDARSRVAAAAGGTVLVRRDALEQIGGIESLRGALIDDVALAARLKPHGPIYLGHSVLARSVRPYPGAADIWRMVARTAYVQLRFSPLILLGTMAGLALVWLAPPILTVFGHGPARWMAAAAWLGASLSYVPTLRRFRQPALWALALPAIATFYMAATAGSAIDHHRGRGVQWKNRAYRGAGA